MICIGLDPGLGGALSLLDTEANSIHVWDMPLRQEGKKRKLDHAAYLDMVEQIWRRHTKVDRVYVELVATMTGREARSSMFSFGQVYGAQVMGLYAFDFEPKFVRPNVWKPAIGIGASKDSSLIACLDIFGDEHRSLWFGRNMGVLDGRCEATLIAYYGSRKR